MENDTVMEIIEKGKIEYLDKSIDVNTLIWNDHPSYAGVSLKHLVRGKKLRADSVVTWLELTPGMK